MKWIVLIHHDPDGYHYGFAAKRNLS